MNEASRAPVRRALPSIADDSLIFQFLGDGRIFRVNVGCFLSGSCLKIDKIFARDDFAGVCVNRNHIKTERIG